MLTDDSAGNQMPGAIRSTLDVLSQAVAPKPRATRVDLRGRHAVVTGVAPRSIGYDIAKTLAGWGASVVGTNLDSTVEIEGRMRSQLEQSGAQPKLINICPLDLCEPRSVNAFVNRYRKQADVLHLLINNAGTFKDFAMRRSEPLLAPDGEEIHWRTNFLGTFHLTYSLLPMLQAGGQASGDARIVFLASDTHKRVQNHHLFTPPVGKYRSWDAYGGSKLALIHLGKELQRQYAAEHNLRTASLHPGTVHSQLISEGLANNPCLRKLNNLIAPMFSMTFLTPEQGAQTPIHCATCVPFQGGEYYERCKVSSASPEADDAEVSARIWKYAEKWVSELGTP